MTVNMACTYLPSPGAIGSKIKKGCQPDLLILITVHSNCQQCGSSSEVVSVTWPLDNIREIHIRRFQLQDCALEVFLTTGHSVLLAFTDTQHRNQVGDWVSFLSFLEWIHSFVGSFGKQRRIWCVFFSASPSFSFSLSMSLYKMDEILMVCIDCFSNEYNFSVDNDFDLNRRLIPCVLWPLYGIISVNQSFPVSYYVSLPDARSAMGVLGDLLL